MLNVSENYRERKEELSDIIRLSREADAAISEIDIAGTATLIKELHTAIRVANVSFVGRSKYRLTSNDTPNEVIVFCRSNHFRWTIPVRAVLTGKNSHEKTKGYQF